jgi:CyaY protein
MSTADFSTHYEKTLLAIEDAVERALEESDVDLDYESVNDILTLTCPDGSAIIITRQSATQQLWLAAKSGGFHFDMDGDGWTCDTDGQSLAEKLGNICRQQAGVDIQLS